MRDGEAMRLSVRGLALAIGVTWGVGVFCLGLASMAGWGVALVDALGAIYIGFRATILGSLIGALWAFVDGGLGGVLLAWLYNRFA